ncbi:MAG: class II aldolase/adducin family protein [Actinobacteria bacterium]|nr:class II aldolase/adducin family protein [Actinomycetota bacterium]
MRNKKNSLKRFIKFPYNDFEISEPAAKLVEITRLIFDRKLTDSCGGNSSIRHENNIYITPRFSGEYFHWRLSPENIIVMNESGELIKGELSNLSRESDLHLRIFHEFSWVNGIIHAHPQNVIACEVRYGEIPAITHMMAARMCRTVEKGNPDFKDLSPEQNEDIIKIFKKRDSGSDPQALAVILPGHGLIVAEVNIFRAFSLLESIDVNAYALLSKGSLG